MGCVQQAVLEFDEEVRAPWRPRLVQEIGVGGGVGEAVSGRAPRSRPARPNPSRVGACRPPAVTVRAGGRVGRGSPPSEARRPSVSGVSVAPRPGRRAVPGRAGPVRLRLTRRARRLAIVLMLAMGVALGSWLEPLAGGGGEDALRLAGVTSVVVEPGDSLWSIAAALESDGDVRAVVDQIQELNDLAGADLVPGQILKLP